jgi:hypothetical protein
LNIGPKTLFFKLDQETQPHSAVTQLCHYLKKCVTKTIIKIETPEDVFIEKLKEISSLQDKDEDVNKLIKRVRANVLETWMIQGPRF